MTYVQDTEWDTTHSYYILDPYFQIANQYGFANWMFQTNQGPSVPAHQFLFSGTSAPIYWSNLGGNDPCVKNGSKYPCYQWFDAPITGAKYQPSCFHTHGCFPTYPVDPDNDADED